MGDTLFAATPDTMASTRTKKVTKILAVSFAVMALVVQLVSGVMPGESNSAMAQTGNDPDHIITGGFSSKEQLLGIYDANKDRAGHTDIKQIYTQYGVSRQDIQNAQVATFNTNDFNGQLKVLGRQNHNVSNRTAVKIEGTNTTVYTGGWLDGYNHKKWTYKALVGKRAVDGKWFAVMFDCGNIVYTEEPKKPQPPVVKKIQVCDLATKKIVEIDEKAYDSKKHSKNVEDCKVKPVEKTIEVCDLTTKKVVTIKESQFDSTKHSKDMNDCKEAPVVKNIEVCDTTTKKVVTIKENEFDSAKHSKDMNDCKNIGTPAPVTPVEKTPEQPAPAPAPVELPRTGLADGISGLFGLGSVVAAAGYYVSSRRNLLTTLLDR